jgi:hypothetical protein
MAAGTASSAPSNPGAVAGVELSPVNARRRRDRAVVTPFARSSNGGLIKCEPTGHASSRAFVAPVARHAVRSLHLRRARHAGGRFPMGPISLDCAARVGYVDLS